MPTIRQKLTIQSVQEPKSFGTKGGQKVEFVCDTKKWVTFRKALFPYILVGEIDADTEIKEREVDGNTYVDRIVSQVYIDGKGVASQAQQTYRGDGDSPEKRASIEAQQAAEYTKDLWIAGKFLDDSPEVKALRTWVLARLTPQVSTKAETSKGTETSAVAKPPTKAAVPVAGAGEITLAVPKEGMPEGKPKARRDPMILKNYTQLCKVCNEDFGLQPKDVLKELGVSAQSEITRTIPECYMQIAAVMEGPKELA